MPLKSPLTTLGLTSQQGSLQAFYKKFCSNTSLEATHLINYVNTPTFFECSIKNITPYVPVPPATPPEKPGFFQSKFAKATIGRILGDMNNEGNKVDFNKALTSDETSLTDKNSSFLYILKNCLNFDFDADFKYFVQKVELPTLELKTNNYYNNFLHEPFPTYDSHANVDKNIVTLHILDTLVPLHEYVFYPWMQEAGADRWAYIEQPFSRADLHVTYLFPEDVRDWTEILDELLSVKAWTGGLFDGDGMEGLAADKDNTFMMDYIFKNCYPVEIGSPYTDQTQRKTFTRPVKFAFSHVEVSLSGIKEVSVQSKLAKAAIERLVNPLLNRAADAIETLPFMGNR